MNQARVILYAKRLPFQPFGKEYHEKELLHLHYKVFHLV